MCGGAGVIDSGGWTPWGSAISTPCPKCEEESRIVELHQRKDLEKMSRCRVCGKPIAACCEPLCCEHLYGRKIINDKEGGEEDCVERMSGFVGSRILEGFNMMRDR